jgi:hypothetical protein
MRYRVALTILALPAVAAADCYCTCINGQNQAICDRAYEMKPLCGQSLCPLEPPSVKPINPPYVPPIGTRVCQQEYVWDHNYGKYVWKQVCR